MMKRISPLCTFFLLLVTSISTYAGVTADGVTAYRYSASHEVVVFTNTPSDDPSSSAAPFGAGILLGSFCSSTQSTSHIDGLVCNGTSGDPVADYICDFTFTPNANNTTWCLFSENPRTVGKAWAVKYVGGFIPTNDGASIVRCEGTDIFDSGHGCLPKLPTAISIEDGYMKMGTTGGLGPANVDCSEKAHNGRMVVDDENDLLYICTDSGWISK